MLKTQRLFDIDAKMRNFDATVMSCEPSGDGRYLVTLDRTAFFPEGGGQRCDGGTLGGAKVLFVSEKDDVITHTTDTVLEVGSCVSGSIDFDVRFRKMQNHTGEHIISGLIYKHYGYHNVGFHLGGEITADFDGELSADDIRKIEDLANEVVVACRDVRAYYPSESELRNMEYRSKLELSDGVRIVDIDGVDKCACCAPHVSNTGEVGQIRILDSIRYKGGSRIYMRCGFDALDDYRSRLEQIQHVSMAISAKQSEIGDGVDRLVEELGRKKGQISALRREIMGYKLASLEHSERSVCIFDFCDDALALRNFVNDAVKKTDRICAVFSGSDGDGYKYIIASEKIKLRALSSLINERLCGCGGGSDAMIQGSCSATEEEIRSFFDDDSWIDG